MAIGKKDRTRQQPMWIPHTSVVGTPGHPFYKKLNQLLAKEKFDQWLERLCEPYFRQGGRPSIPPGTYFRMLMIGYFEGISSERAIAWRCADSLSLREFLGLDLTEKTPDHSTLSVWRKRLDLAIYQDVFRKILSIVERHGLLKGEILGVDSTTIEANAAMRSIVRKDTGETYREYLASLAREEGIEAPTAEDLRKFDRKRKGRKTSNRDFESPTDPDSRIAKMKDGTTHLAFKAENAVDGESSVVVAADIFPADKGDTQTLLETVDQSLDNLQSIDCDKSIVHLVTDKGYHKAALIEELYWEQGITTYIPERKSSKRRKWDGNDKGCRAFHANRRRCTSGYGKWLIRQRAAIVERVFAHLKVTGGLRRIHLHGRENVQKRYIAHVFAYNLSVLMRAVSGMGSPKSSKGRKNLLRLLILGAVMALLLKYLLTEEFSRIQQPVLH
jgi:transposase